MNTEQEILVKRLKEAGLHTRRFNKVDDEKAAFEFEWQKNPYTPEELDAQGWKRWGVIGRTGLVLIDTDNEQMSDAIRQILPATFEVLSLGRKLPHFYFGVEGGDVENKILHLKGDTKGAGEIRAQNYYLVAAGTVVKNGKYEILHDRPIAKVKYADFMKAIKPYLGGIPSQRITLKQMREGVPKGTRHAQGIKYATFLIGVKKFDDATALHEMKEWNQLCRPPMDERDLERMVENARKYVEGRTRKEEKAAAEKVDPRRYFTVNEDGSAGKFIPKRLADDINKDHWFATHRESWVIHRYQDGIYLLDGEATIREMCRERLGELAKEHYISEVVNHIQDTTFHLPTDFNPPTNLICLENGILDLNTSELSAHTPDLIFLNKLPVKYDPNAKAPKCGKFWGSWMNQDDVVRAIQFMGFCLYREYFIRKVVICEGGGGNGKTTFVAYLTKWLGDKNACSIPVQDFDRNRFATALLAGKLGNLCDDLPNTEWFNTGRFKQATGGAQMEGEVKFQDPFFFTNHAKMLFTANKLPIVSDDTRAFWERIMLISFPNHFDGSISRKKIWAEMLTPEEKSGMLNAALVGLRMISRRGDFYKPEDIEVTRSRYKHASDPVVAFVEDCVIETPEENIPKNQLYSEYCNYCKKHGFAPSMDSVFARMLKRIIANIREGRLTIEGERTTVWFGLRLARADETHEALGEQTTLPTPLDVRDVREIASIISFTDTTVVELDKIGKTPGIPATPDSKEDLGALPKPSKFSKDVEMPRHPDHPKQGEKTQKTEPTTQDIIDTVLSFSGAQVFKVKIAERAGVGMDRLDAVLEELEKKRAIISRGAMVEVL